MILVACVLAGFGCDTMQPLATTPAGGALNAEGAPAGQNLPTMADQNANDGRTAADLARDIEEADIVKLAGDRLYALNQMKGLIILDVSNPDAPTLLGTLDLAGRGVEMYVVGERVFVLLSADVYHFYYELDGPLLGAADVPGATSAQMISPDGPVPLVPDFEGSRLAIVDVSDPTAASVLGKIELVGFATESRRVGDVIYIAGSNYGCFGGYRDTLGEDEHGFIASVNVADPDDIVPVDRETFDGDSLALHVSQGLALVASNDWDTARDRTITHVQYVDITDPAGAIVLRGTVDVPGTIRNRFYMDDDAGVLRIATQSFGFGFSTVRVYTYDLGDPDAIAPLGSVDIIEGESLQAVRFDGPRGYVVTFLQVDPLFVLDLSDPAAPTVAGFLEVPGYSTHIEPRGDRLVAVGVDDTDGFRPAVAYYDVTDPAAPAQLGRIILGPPGAYAESEAVYDEKAFKIVDELGLIAIPFKYVDYSDWAPVVVDSANGAQDAVLAEGGWVAPECLNAVQLVDFDDTGLTQRGWFEHRGRVLRVGMVEDRVFSLSQVGFQTVDITDRDNPQAVGRVLFFDGEDLPYYLDDCSNEFPIGGPGGDELPLLIQIFINGDMCGTGVATMAGGCFLGLGLMRRTRRR